MTVTASPNTLAPASPFEAIVVEPMPTLPRSDLSAVLSELRDLRGKRVDTYGGYHFPNATLEDYEACKKFIRESCIGLRVNREDMGFGFRPFHTDSGWPNDATAHYTEKGECDFLVVMGGKVRRRRLLGETVRSTTLEIAARNIVAHSVVDRSVVTRSQRVWLAACKTGSLIVFDHSQLHAISNASGDRKSRFSYPQSFF